MKGRVIVLSDEPAVAALIVDGVVEDWLAAPRPGLTNPLPGEIRQARADRPAPGQKAWFVRLSGGGTGYLRGDAPPKGKPFPVQVQTRPEPGKAVPVDTRLLIKGHHLILTPGRPGINVSRRIRDAEEKARLATALGGIAEDPGVIVRSSAAGAEAGLLEAEYAALSARLVQALEAEQAELFDPAAIALRDWVDPETDAILGSAAIFDRLDQSGALLGVEGLAYVEPDDLLDRFGVWETASALARPDTALSGDASMCIEQTRALVAVDVNTGAGFSAGAAEAANRAAIAELPRQLRLRGLGGQVVLDLAPLKKGARKGVEAALTAALKSDTVETTLAGWTPLGHLELTRKRERLPLHETVLSAA